MVEKAAVGKRENEGEDSGKTRVADQTAGMTERASTLLSIYPSDPQGRDDAVAREGAQNSVKKGSTSIQGERGHEPRGAHPAHEV
jgi:hypothetical protein